ANLDHDLAEHHDPEADPTVERLDEPAHDGNADHDPTKHLAADDQHPGVDRVLHEHHQRTPQADNLDHVPDLHDVDHVHHFHDVEALRPMATETDRSHEHRPVLFVLDREATSLTVLLAALTRRFGKDFRVRGDDSPRSEERRVGK